MQVLGSSWVLTVLTFWGFTVWGLEGYDCTAECTTYEVIDLLETDSCPEQQKKYKELVMKRIQVLHSYGKRRLPGLICRIVENLVVMVCDAAWHYTSNYQFPIWRQPVIVSIPDCHRMIKDKKWVSERGVVSL